MIIVEPILLSSNFDHTLFKDPLGNHDKGKASSSNSSSQTTINYNHTRHDYTINFFNDSDSCMSTFTLKNEDPHCVVTMCRTKITLPGAPGKPTSPTSFDYNLVDQLAKTLTQISILYFLHISPQHQKILNQALKESLVPGNTDVS